MKLVISKSVTTNINLIITVECKHKCRETKNPANGRVFILDYLASITATYFINLHFVEAPGIEALIEYKTKGQ